MKDTTSDIIKSQINNIYNLFINNSYSKNILIIENKSYEIEFIIGNNYHSCFVLNDDGNYKISIKIPINGKERKIKENLLNKLINLNDYDNKILNEYSTYTKYSKINYDEYIIK
jgi:hypothetical protein